MKSEKIKVLIVEDDIGLQKFLVKLLMTNNYNAIISRTVAEAGELFEKFSPDVVLSDLMLGDDYGLDLLVDLKKIKKDIPFIIMTAYGSVESAVKALKLGAYDYITKPIDIDKLLKILENLKELIYLKKEVAELRKKKDSSEAKFIGISKEIKHISEIIEQIKDIDTTVLLTGETGVGKEVVAKSIHYLSSRADKPFISINCAAIPATLIESELFGAEKGAYTGANKTIIGKFESAKDGTIFLDEISEMDVSLQAKLLRVLQEHSFYRLGGNQIIHTNARIIAATNKRLEDLIASGRFREDLFYRLNVLPINIPPLRERKEDIPLLAQFFLDKLNEKHNKNKHFNKQTIDFLCKYNWPGNIRELENAVQRAFIFSSDDVIEKNDFSFLYNNQTLLQDNDEWIFPAGKTMAEYENMIISNTLKKCGNNKSLTSKILGISERALYYKLKTLKKMQTNAKNADRV